MRSFEYLLYIESIHSFIAWGYNGSTNHPFIHTCDIYKYFIITKESINIIQIYLRNLLTIIKYTILNSCTALVPIWARHWWLSENKRTLERTKLFHSCLSRLMRDLFAHQHAEFKDESIKKYTKYQLQPLWLIVPVCLQSVNKTHNDCFIENTKQPNRNRNCYSNKQTNKQIFLHIHEPKIQYRK